MPVDPSPYTHDGVPVLRLLQDMASAAMASLAQTPRGLPGRGGLWHGSDALDDCPDQLLLWVRDWAPVNLGSFPNQAVELDRCNPLDFDPHVVVSLRRPCAPIPDDRGQVDPDDEGASAEDLIVDARALLCGVQAAWPPLIEANYPAARIQWGQMVPTAGGAVYGWDLDAFLEISSCRSACQP